MTLQLLGRFLKCRVQTERSVTDKTVGLMQGAVLSPLLSSIENDQPYKPFKYY